ncbi:hypothetical protein T439DRAFT_383584 [Meredithblackwellia eburnea MCA 4105]
MKLSVSLIALASLLAAPVMGGVVGKGDQDPSKVEVKKNGMYLVNAPTGEVMACEKATFKWTADAETTGLDFFVSLGSHNGKTNWATGGAYTFYTGFDRATGLYTGWYKPTTADSKTNGGKATLNLFVKGSSSQGIVQKSLPFTVKPNPNKTCKNWN